MCEVTSLWNNANKHVNSLLVFVIIVNNFKYLNIPVSLSLIELRVYFVLCSLISSFDVVLGRKQGLHTLYFNLNRTTAEKFINTSNKKIFFEYYNVII